MPKICKKRCKITKVSCEIDMRACVSARVCVCVREGEGRGRGKGNEVTFEQIDRH